MVCSVLIPSRGRPDSLIWAVRSFGAFVSDKKEVEVLVKLDEDDQLSLNRISEIREAGAQVVITPRGAGYLDLHRFYSILAVLARGDWLWMFNDDARVLTNNWDKVLSTQTHAMVVPWVKGPESYGEAWNAHFQAQGWHYDFPIISRKLLHQVGQFSHSPANDCYWHDIACGIPGLRQEVHELEVLHNYDRDETHPWGDGGDSFGVMNVHRQPEVSQQVARAIHLIGKDYGR
jgi:hypothetical protein